MTARLINKTEIIRHPKIETLLTKLNISTLSAIKSYAAADKTPILPFLYETVHFLLQ